MKLTRTFIYRGADGTALIPFTPPFLHQTLHTHKFEKGNFSKDLHSFTRDFRRDKGPNDSGATQHWEEKQTKNKSGSQKQRIKQTPGVLLSFPPFHATTTSSFLAGDMRWQQVAPCTYHTVLTRRVTTFPVLGRGTSSLPKHIATAAHHCFHSVVTVWQWWHVVTWEQRYQQQRQWRQWCDDCDNMWTVLELNPYSLSTRKLRLNAFPHQIFFCLTFRYQNFPT